VFFAAVWTAGVALDAIGLLDRRKQSVHEPSGGAPEMKAAVDEPTSGARGFSAGTAQWSWGLGPHWIDEPGMGGSYQDPPTTSTDRRISQATYNILADMGATPSTPTQLQTRHGASQRPGS
jgi:hypothetical protein